MTIMSGLPHLSENLSRAVKYTARQTLKSFCGSCAGNGGEDGRLNKTEANEVKRYQTVLQHLNKPEVQQMVLTSISGIVLLLLFQQGHFQSAQHFAVVIKHMPESAVAHKLAVAFKICEIAQ